MTAGLHSAHGNVWLGETIVPELSSVGWGAGGVRGAERGGSRICCKMLNPTEECVMSQFKEIKMQMGGGANLGGTGIMY